MPTTEQITRKLYKHYTGTADTRLNRDFFEEALRSSFTVRPDQLWMYGDQIPKPVSKKDATYIKIKNFKDGDVWTWQKDESTFIPVFTKHENYPLTKIDNGTDSAFKLVDEEGNQVQNIIPFNYALDLYNYYLTTDTGERIYFGVGDWQLDTYSGVLTFYGDVPAGVSHDHPPKITFYQYTGGTGFRQDTYGYDGATLPLENWHINKGSYIIDTNSNNDNESLYEHICREANKVEDGFAGTYGWDGADKNEGIALSLEKIIALEYTFTKDKVKGYDDSADAEIGTLLSDKIPHLNWDSLENKAPFAITFASQGLLKTKDYKIIVENGQASFENGSTKSIVESGIYKLQNGTEDAFIIIYVSSNVPDGEYTFTVTEEPEKVRALLLYWNKNTQEYLPFITKEETNCNFGFTIVAINGKIPPSVTMDSAAISAYSDSITPDYYGPRNFTVTVALEGEYSTKSADYVVKNKSSFYLDDIITRIISDFTIRENNKSILDFKGTIFLRAGTYIINNSIDLSKFKNLSIIGESGKNVIIHSNELKSITYNNNEDAGFILLKEITLENISLNIKTHTETFFIRNITSNSSLSIENYDNNIFVTESSFKKISIKNNLDLNSSSDNTDDSKDLTKLVVELTHLSTEDLTVDAANVFVNNIYANKATFKEHENVIVASCFFYSVLEKPKIVQFRSCRVSNFAATIDRQDIPNTGMFPIYSKLSDQYLQYAAFERYFNYEEDKNLITFNIDSEYLYWKIKNDDGDLELSCHIDASHITVDDTYDRDPNYIGEPTSTGGTLQGALKDLYLTKADLVSGKVPLTELPDSVAYGGLLYIGSWSFDENNGEYPTFEGTIGEHPYLSLDLKVDENKLQPGWFWVVSASKEKAIDNPVSDQLSALQYKFDENGKLKVLATSLDSGQVSTLEKLTISDIERILSDDTSSTSNDTSSDDSSSTLSTQDKRIKDMLLTGGLVYTAGDWIIWNGSYFEKLDRAYQDPVYSILPVYTTGDNSDSASGRIAWYWRQSRDSFENGWGLGALDLGKKTIGEAFDQVNIELKRLQVKHPANIADLQLKPIKEYLKTQYRKVENNTISTEISEAYDMLLDKTVLRFSVQTPQGNTWKDLIYFGDSGTITGYIDDDSEAYIEYKTSPEVTLSYDKDTGKQTTFTTIAKPIDPYKDEFIGEGYFWGTKVGLYPKENLTAGEHIFKVGVSDISPNNPNFVKGVVGVTPQYKINIINPYTLGNANLDTGKGRRIIVEQTIKDAEKAGYCSGVKSIKIKNEPFTFVLTYRIKDAILGMVNVDNDKLIKVYSNINKDLVTPEFRITSNIDKDVGYSDYYMSNSSYQVQSDLVWTSFSLSAIIYDVYGNEKEFNNIFNYTIRFDPTTEDERVFSGKELYPVYNPNKKALCGNNEWDSSKSLVGDENYIPELQKVGRNIFKGGNNIRVSEYKWPAGLYNEFDPDEKVDYTKVENGVEINEDLYRFVTLTKFGDPNNLEEVLLDSNSGFTLDFNITEDNLDKWTCNEFSMVTNNIIIQAKVINPSIESGDPSVTSWIDCNAPFDGFLLVGSEDGDEAMYAGESSAISKRITFGCNTFSGKLIIRVGIKKDSNISFQSITIRDLI